MSLLCLILCLLSLASTSFISTNNSQFNFTHGLLIPDHNRLSVSHLSNTILRSTSFLHRHTYPSSFDWREEHPDCIPPIQNQEHCGGCWAFVAAYAFSAKLCASTGTLVDPSEMEILRCSRDNPCEGGYLTDPSDYGVNGIRSRRCYPYSDVDHAPCLEKCVDKSESAEPVIYTRRSRYNSRVSIEWMKQKVLDEGPLAITFPIFSSFYNYKEGIYVPHSTPNDVIVGWHAVNIIGWEGDSYFICSNSWGTKWGEAGYFKVDQNTEFIDFGQGVVSYQVNEEPFAWYNVGGFGYSISLLVLVLLLFIAFYLLVKSLLKCLKGRNAPVYDLSYPVAYSG
ncbi:hypothetical protein P9112_009721 [Eukaryota sp. TZLM1-RC]